MYGRVKLIFFHLSHTIATDTTRESNIKETSCQLTTCILVLKSLISASSIVMGVSVALTVYL